MLTSQDTLTIAADPARWTSEELLGSAAFWLKQDDSSNSFRTQLVDQLNTAGDATAFFRTLLKRESADSKASTSLPEKTVRATATGGRFVPAQGIQPLSLITAAELDRKQLRPIQWIVEDLLPTGLAMLGAPSKYYKSYLALDLCSSVCMGASFLGHKTVKGAALYFDLESSERRPQSRLKQILGDQPKPDNFFIHAGLRGVCKIGSGFEGQLRQVLALHPDIRLVVVDVLQKIRPEAKFRQTGYDRDYTDLTALQQLALENDICLLLIHHTRKMRDDLDVFNTLSGSVGIMGALDTAWVIEKKRRQDSEGALHVTGRDIESLDLCVEFDRRSMRWRNLGTSEEVEDRKLSEDYRKSQVVATIRKLLSSSGGTWAGAAQDIEAASHYLGTHINMDLPHIGNEIGRFEQLMLFDGISFKKQRTNKANIYTFVSTDSSVNTVSTASTVSTV